MPDSAYTAKIQGNSCRVVNIATGQTALVLTPTQPPLSANITGEFVSVTLRSGRVEVYNIRTRQLVRAW